MNDFFKNLKYKKNNYPYVIAEIGVNHEGDIKQAKELIESAARGGANAAKFQTYKAESLASVNSPYYWDINKEKSKTQFELFKKYDRFNKEEYEELYNHCIKFDIDFLTTPFDINSLDFLDPLLKFYKIASADINNIPLLKAVASKNKPIVLSTGASNIDEIKFALKILDNNGVKEVSLLHCVLNYPTLNSNANLNMIKDLKKNFPTNIIGYSDHTLPDPNMNTIKLAYLYGAKIIEKHFTLNKKLPGNDHYHSMDEFDLLNFFKELDFINELSGLEKKESLEIERSARLNARRSIVLNKDKFKGEIISENDITVKRPGTGISPIYWDEIIGKKIKSHLKKDHILNREDIEN